MKKVDTLPTGDGYLAQCPYKDCGQQISYSKTRGGAVKGVAMTFLGKLFCRSCRRQLKRK